MRQRQDEAWRFETRAKTGHASVESETRHEMMKICVSRHGDKTRVEMPSLRS